jgi:hypothetical protein
MRKQHLLLLLLPLLIVACKPKATEAPAASTTTPAYPYTIKHPDYWMIDTSHANTMVVLSALKAFEKMDTLSMKKYFADSITFNYDNGTFKGTNAQLLKMATDIGTTMKNMKLDVKDWESVTSNDKKEEWVTVWYTQKWTGAKGTADSVELINDMQLKGGKIVKFDEYTRHFKTK